MALGEQIRTRLAGTSAVTTLVSTRIYAEVLPQESAATDYPAITYSIIDQDSIGHMSGKSNLAESLIQITSWATTPDGAEALDAAVMSSLDRYQGGLVRRSFAGRLQSGYEKPLDKGDIGKFFARREFRVWHCES